jgi:hypothetical protein
MSKRTLELVSAVIIPFCILIFVVSQRVGFWDWWFGLNDVEKVAVNFETSYASDASHPVRPGDPSWQPLLILIRNYSHVDLPKGREPKVFARSVAISSQKMDLGDGKFAEWTAPTTPIILIYRDWPGQTVPPTDYRIVGSIADLRTWINRSKDDFRFIVQDFSLTFLSLVFAIMIWLRK